MPVRDAVAALEIVRAAGVRWIGPSTPGLAIPGKLKLGFLPDVSLAPGPLGIMAKSGTLSSEVCHRLVSRGLGQSLWVGVGGDPVKGTRFADVLPFMLTDPNTHGIVVIGEIGGSEEEELAAAMRAQNCSKPVYALIAGRTVREGITMGHAGAMIQRCRYDRIKTEGHRRRACVRAARSRRSVAEVAMLRVGRCS
jgi:succinyl-CoA synthetase alpha subunit